MTKEHSDVLVVGAGWAGLAAADALQAAGRSVVVIEKARGPGGRSATRRHGDWSFDHGAQYFTAYTEDFQLAIRQWSEQGLVSPWAEPIHVFGQRPNHISRAEREGSLTRWVGVPGNNAVLKALSDRLSVRYQHKLTELRSTNEGWRVEVEAGDQRQAFYAGDLIITAPPAQAAELLGEAHPLFEVLNDHPMTPTLALMMGFDQPLALDVSAAFVNEGPLSWFCRQSTKPGRDGEAWVLHATPEWSQAWLDQPQDAAASALYRAWAELLGVIGSQPTFMQMHRWRYAQSDSPLDRGFLADPRSHVWVAGDWCNGNRVEGAWLSGRALAEALTKSSFSRA